MAQCKAINVDTLPVSITREEQVDVTKQASVAPSIAWHIIYYALLRWQFGGGRQLMPLAIIIVHSDLGISLLGESLSLGETSIAMLAKNLTRKRRQIAQKIYMPQQQRMCGTR